MKLLIVTQIVDRNDPVLGFFYTWIEELSKKVDSVVVICLKEGEHSLPANVNVYSLGKEKGDRSRVWYSLRFLWLVWKLRREYDRVFVHMNQEYLLLAGDSWCLMGKPVYLWRNHYDGSWLTDAAAFYCTKVFCTSKHSYTARYKKTILMPVGIDTSRFSLNETLARKPRSILFFSRIAPSKRPDVYIDALKILKERDIDFSASIYGDPLPRDEAYYASLKRKVETLGLADRVTFYPGVPLAEASKIFSSHELFVNCSKSGMFDKTLFEAAACGCLVIASSDDFRSLVGEESFFNGSPESLAHRLIQQLAMNSHDRSLQQAHLGSIAANQGLPMLVDRLVAEMAL